MLIVHNPVIADLQTKRYDFKMRILLIFLRQLTTAVHNDFITHDTLHTAGALRLPHHGFSYIFETNSHSFYYYI